MNLNFLAIPTSFLAALVFWAGLRYARKFPSKTAAWGGVLAGGVLAIPWATFAAYYLCDLSGAQWFYWFRALRFTELSAAFGGFLFGMLYERIKPRRAVLRHFTERFFAYLFAVLLWLPYLLPMSRPLDWTHFEDNWVNGVCLQSSPSTCGPACAATLLRAAGIDATERELAEEALTHAAGTETWYLARTMRRRGLAVKVCVNRGKPYLMPMPSIAAVRLRRMKGSKHFIVLFGKGPDGWIVGDPNEGRLVLAGEDLRENYDFSGCYIVVEVHNKHDAKNISPINF